MSKTSEKEQLLNGLKERAIRFVRAAPVCLCEHLPIAAVSFSY